MTPCKCQEAHTRRRIVLTGGPGAGKTAVLELIRASFCNHVKVLPEAAGVVFGGGFPRAPEDEARRAAQRAIFYVQRELEAAAAVGNPAILLCDRGTIDGAAYWPGPADLWSSVGTTLVQELLRYDVVIHLRTPPSDVGYNQANPVRVETAAEAAAIDERILRAWESHPKRFVIESSADFLDKAARAVETLWEELPACCQQHAIPNLALRRGKSKASDPRDKDESPCNAGATPASS